MNDPLFSSPTDYCDRICERCPLAWDCQISAEDLRFDLHVHDKPPISPDVDLVRARIRHRSESPARAARGRPLSTSQCLSDERAKTLRHSANAFYVAVDQAVGHRLTEDGSRGEDVLYRGALILVVCCWRLADRTQRTTRSRRRAVATPLLLLLEEQRGGLAKMIADVRTMDAVAGRRLHDAHLRLWEVLDPMTALASQTARNKLAALVARGCAPSPFCQVVPDWESRLELEPETHLGVSTGTSESSVDRDHLAV